MATVIKLIYLDYFGEKENFDMAETLTEGRPNGVVLITDVFQNISQVPVAVENHLDVSSETTDYLYAQVEQSTGDYGSEDYNEYYFHDDFTNYTSSIDANYEYSNDNLQQPHRSDGIWKDFNITSAQLNHSDLYNFSGNRWDPRANFMEGVIGNLFLVPSAFIVGLLIGVILWGIFVFLRKLFILLMRWLKTTLPHVLDRICCVRLLYFEPKLTKSKTVWYEDSVSASSNDEEENIEVSYNKHLSEIRKVRNVNELNKSKKLDENDNQGCPVHGKRGRKVSNSIFFLTNGMYNGLESHQLSG